MNEKPTENRGRRQADNTPIGLDDAEKTSPKTTQKSVRAGLPMAFVIVGLVCICVLGLIWGPIYLDYPISTPTPTPDWSATRIAWVKPEESPTLGSAIDAKAAYEEATYRYLWNFFIGVAGVEQPSGVFNEHIILQTPQPLLWTYSLCATTQDILDESFMHMSIEFTLNEESVPLSNISVPPDIRFEDNFICRRYVTLIEIWTPGTHLLEQRITFTKLTDTGLTTIHPAGTEVYKYYVTVNP